MASSDPYRLVDHLEDWHDVEAEDMDLEMLRAIHAQLHAEGRWVRRHEEDRT